MLKCRGQVVNLFIPQPSKLSVSLGIVRLDDNADAKKILTAFPPEDWKRPPGSLGLKTVLNDLEHPTVSH